MNELWDIPPGEVRVGRFAANIERFDEEIQCENWRREVAYRLLKHGIRPRFIFFRSVTRTDVRWAEDDGGYIVYTDTFCPLIVYATVSEAEADQARAILNVPYQEN
jgi:hypothetical protein